ncbi:prolyl oligopeptidase family serine peptidase [Paenibacillus aceris]|uniref:Peptidase n=1 Tax=Paenibacillus aceris TaxID=869555 RepID=A0ABS4I6X3_9BACL|nr:prolyl oligopeptidase family serine peptidase [Paenibacillus aceris]MBP1966470.1 putative peptidase [Paenibacillus aceris]NHW39552.1 prolyl oligopeptidase family serine peptidase [Paenibacillus aceris]
MPIDNRRLDKVITKRVNLGYQLFVPTAYEENLEKKWPLIMFLHGIKKRGDDIHLLDDYGLTWMAEKQGDFKFFVLTPQCPALSSWPYERDGLIALLDEICSTYQVDTERIYLTGFSMGGNGAWDMAAHHPDRFAAVAPLAGWFDAQKAHLLSKMPVWTFHGEDDDVVSINGSKTMVEALQQRGEDVAFTTFPGLKHSIMNEVYNNPALFDWFMKYKRRLAEVNRES